jgi:hypothetical protein
MVASRFLRRTGTHPYTPSHTWSSLPWSNLVTTKTPLVHFVTPARKSAQSFTRWASYTETEVHAVESNFILLPWQYLIINWKREIHVPSTPLIEKCLLTSQFWLAKHAWHRVPRIFPSLSLLLLGLYLSVALFVKISNSLFLFSRQ